MLTKLFATGFRKPLSPLDFTELDRQIYKLRELRDSYRSANVLYYGKQLAGMLDD